MRLALTADLDALSGIREFVTDAMIALGTDPDVHDEIRLAVDEAVTNILTHGYKGPGPVELDIAADGDDLVVVIADEAPLFDPTQSTDVDLTPPGERQAPGGYGLFLIRQAMDDVLYRKSSRGNELRLIRRGVVHTGQSGMSA